MIRRARLISGLVLFVYVTTHLLNHTLGLVSYQAMEEGRTWFLLGWRNPVGTTLLYGSILVHFILAFWALYRPRRLWLPPGEMIRVFLGLIIPLLLALHVSGTRGANQLAGTDDNYAYVLLVHFKFAPEYFYLQTAALLTAWTHGCLGLHFWLRIRPWYGRISAVLLAPALLVPTLALLGFVAGGREVLALAENKSWLLAITAQIDWPDAAEQARIGMLTTLVWGITGAALAVTLVGRVVRREVLSRRGLITITYPGGRQVDVTPGTTILKASLINRIPHASICGGRGRCSTCRVRICSGIDDLTPPATEESRLLNRIGAPPSVRLACQARPTHDIEVLPLLPPDAGVEATAAREDRMQGQEREIAVLFADMRNFTGLSENKLPYDVVYILNRYFTILGEAVDEAGGHLDKFIGDGAMALFGVETGIEEGCRQALKAARLIAVKLDGLNQALENDLELPLRVGIGIHAGPAIVGEMGYGRATQVTAIGDTVNTASRLEGITKEFGAHLIVSQAVADHAGVDLSGALGHEVPLRGRTTSIPVYVVEDARTLPLEAAAPPG